MIAKMLHRLAADEMLGKYDVSILDPDGTIPDIIGIDDNHGTVPTLTHAAGLIYADR